VNRPFIPADPLAVSIWGSGEVRGTEPYVPRERLPGEATSPGTDLKSRPVYKPGDGDTSVTVRRPGSDHSHLKSFGNPT
jgi:hypothetical protein